jgi:hypothetical protein
MVALQCKIDAVILAVLVTAGSVDAKVALAGNPGRSVAN